LSEGFFSGFGISGRTVPTLLMKSRIEANDGAYSSTSIFPPAASILA
jgi:hypothetical protein